MNYTDTHTHLYDEKLTVDEQQIQRAIDAGVTKLYMPNCNSETIADMLELADKWPTNCFPMMGLHPCYVKEDYKNELDIVAAALTKRKYYAVGEIGLDYYWDLTRKAQQIEAFRVQIELAIHHQLPIVIHSRESTKDCIDIVRDMQQGGLTGIFHCFSGTEDEAKAIVDLGFHLGIGGVVTYKKSNLPDIIQSVALSNIVLETDAPYLAPVPFRGKRNESSYIPYIAQKIAELAGVTEQEVAQITTVNAKKIFEQE